MKLIVGLGNIGKEFENTNHNMGFMVIDSLAKELGLSFKKNMCQSLVAEGNIEGEKVILAKPTTFMNNSGIAVKALVKKFNIDISSSLIIISDDIDLKKGCVRVRKEGSAGTHNGLKSVIRELGSTAFIRLRIGIDCPPENMDLADYVLSRAGLSNELKAGLEKGKEALLMFLKGASVDEIMQKVN